MLIFCSDSMWAIPPAIKNSTEPVTYHCKLRDSHRQS